MVHRPQHPPLVVHRQRQSMAGVPNQVHTLFHCAGSGHLRVPRIERFPVVRRIENKIRTFNRVPFESSRTVSRPCLAASACDVSSGVSSMTRVMAPRICLIATFAGTAVSFASCQNLVWMCAYA